MTEQSTNDSPNPTWKRRSARRVVLLVAAIALVLVAAAFLHRGQDERNAAAAPIGVVGHSADEHERALDGGAVPKTVTDPGL